MKRSVFRGWLFALLTLSAALRIEMATRGGQRFFPDENRYLRSTILLRFLEQGRPSQALDLILTSPDHTGFIAVSFIPAVAQRLWLLFLGDPPGREAMNATLWLPACFLSLASVASVGLVAAIARRAGAERGEALGAAFLMSCALTLLYYSRHLLPYDSAMALALLGLWLGLRNGRGWVRPLFVGLLSGAAFMTYNGYWMTALAVMTFSVLWRLDSARDFAARSVATTLGFISWPAALTALTLSLGRAPFASEMERFSRAAATQSDFSEGWSFPIVFLWEAEHGLLIAFLVGAGLSLFFAAFDPSPATRRGLAFAAVALGMYVLMGLLSQQAERIGVFGRQVRQMVPFLCLATACSASMLLARASRFRTWAIQLVAIGLVVQATVHFRAAFALQFPGEFSREAFVTFGPMSHETTVELGEPVSGGAPTASRYVLLNAGYLYPPRALREAPRGAVVLRASHPLQFRPYQYESFVPEERARLRAADISMRVIDTRGDSPKRPGT